MKHADRIQQAITQVRREMDVTNEGYSPAQNDEYWQAIQKAETDFDVSGVKLNVIIQCKIK